MDNDSILVNLWDMNGDSESESANRRMSVFVLDIYKTQPSQIIRIVDKTIA